MAKMWAGRFQKETDAVVNDFNSSVMFDCRMYAEDIQGSIAHATMLGRQGIIPQDDVHKIIEGLQGILADIEAGKIHFSPELYEDIHMANEQLLTERIGDAGKRLHTARSRNDQVALDMRLYVRREIKEIRALVLGFMHALCEVAAKHTETVMPGYTHLQRAQPITFAHHLMAYANMLKRDVRRLDDCLSGMDALPLGSGALAGTTYPIDRAFVAEQLGFSAVMDNSLDGVSDRDYCIELCADLSILMMHLSRLSEEVIAWCSWEFKFIELDDAYSTGSSIMPQKKNPDICELIRGKTGRVYGALTTLLTFMKAIPLAYNKDMQEDKELPFDAMDTTKGCIALFTGMLDTITFRKDRMRDSARHGFTNATDAADYLVKRGVPFRDAHGIVGRLVLYCIDRSKALDDLTLEEYRAVSPVFEEDIYDAISLETCVDKRLTAGAPGKEAMEKEIEACRAYLKEDCPDRCPRK